MRRPVKIILWSCAGVLILALFFAFGLPAILRTVLESQLAKNLNRPVTVESVQFNPFTLCLTVQGLTIREPDDSAVFLSFERLFVNADIASLFKRGLVLSEVTLEKPHVRVVRAEENSYNFSDMLPAEDAQPEAADEQPAKPFLFSVANIQLIDGSVEFDDRPARLVHTVTGIEIGLPLISNFDQYVDVFVQPSFSATIDGRPFNLNAQTKPFTDSLETDLDLNLTDLELTQYLAYVPVQLNFKMLSGRLNTNLKLRYVQNPGRVLTKSGSREAWALRTLPSSVLTTAPCSAFPPWQLPALPARSTSASLLLTILPCRASAWPLPAKRTGPCRCNGLSTQEMP